MSNWSDTIGPLMLPVQYYWSSSVPTPFTSIRSLVFWYDAIGSLVFSYRSGTRTTRNDKAGKRVCLK